MIIMNNNTLQAKKCRERDAQELLWGGGEGGMLLCYSSAPLFTVTPGAEGAPPKNLTYKRLKENSPF